MLTIFPVLASRRKQPAGTLSGGEQQMLSLARVLVVPPELLIVDELSHGLAPVIVEQVFETLRTSLTLGVTMIVIEQFVTAALGLADHAAMHLARRELEITVLEWHNRFPDYELAEGPTSYFGGGVFGFNELPLRLG